MAPRPCAAARPSTADDLLADTIEARDADLFRAALDRQLTTTEEPSAMTMTADTPATTALKDGRVVAIAGPVVDVEFPPDALPEINYALEMDVELEGETITITAEVAQQIGDSRVRAICLKPTDGLRRGTLVRNTRPRHHDAGRRRRARPRVQRDRRAARHRRERAHRHRRPLGDPPRRRRRSTSSSRRRRCSRPASRSSTCSSPTCRAARSASSAAPASARPCSSRR